MLEIIFIRHGETDWNAGRRIMGPSPVPLNDRGISQIQRLKDLFSEVSFDAIYTSPLVRATQSAEILQEGRDISLHKTEQLTEINYGPWVGQTFDEISSTKEFRDYFLRPHLAKVPEGEDLQQVTKRACDFVESLKKQGNRTRPYRAIAVSHADVIKSILIHYLGLPLKEFHRLRIDNGSYSILWSNAKADRILAINALPNLVGFFEKYTIFSSEDFK